MSWRVVVQDAVCIPPRLSLRRVSAGSGANGHTAVVALRGRTPGERSWFDRNCPHRARSLQGDHKLEEPSRELPTGPGIDPTVGT